MAMQGQLLYNPSLAVMSLIMIHGHMTQGINKCYLHLWVRIWWFWCPHCKSWSMCATFLHQLAPTGLAITCQAIELETSCSNPLKMWKVL